MKQDALPLPEQAPARGRADFLVSGCNEAALRYLERWPNWPGRTLVLYGPEGCGKSHLVALWRERSGAAVIAGDALGDRDPLVLAQGGACAVALDDAEHASERALLHLYNCCRESGASLLIVARATPAGSWPIALPDLASRLRAAPSVAIGLPDDALLAAVLVKQFADRQILVAPNVVDFAVRRMERSFAAAAALADRLDRLALAAQGPITLALARIALADQSPSDFGVT